MTPCLSQFIDDPGLRNDTRNKPVQLPLAHSGWLFKEENEEPDVKPWLAGPREEDMEVDVPVVKGTLCQLLSYLLSCPPRSPQTAANKQVLSLSSCKIHGLNKDAKVSLSERFC